MKKGSGWASLTDWSLEMPWEGCKQKLLIQTLKRSRDCWRSLEVSASEYGQQLQWQMLPEVYIGWIIIHASAPFDVCW
jgi:hypothetical protein